MEYRRLGRSGLEVSSMCLGTMTFGLADEASFMHGVSSDRDTSWAILEAALERGVNFVDTADVYGQDGLSERVIGEWFDHSGRRDEVVLATKFRFRMRPGANGTGASRHRIMRAAEASLRRLKTDRIDLYQIHMQDLDVPEDELLRALDDLVRQGKVLYIGASNYAAYHLMASLGTSERLGLERFVALQPQYSLLCRDIEREHVPACTTQGVGIIPWSPLTGGLLSGKYRRGEEPPAGARLAKWKKRLEGYDNDHTWGVIEAVAAVAEEVGATSAQVALRWLMQKPGVTSVIFGARTPSQLDDNLKASELTLSDAQMATLDEASALKLGYPYEFIAQVQGGRW